MAVLAFAVFAVLARHADLGRASGTGVTAGSSDGVEQGDEWRDDDAWWGSGSDDGWDDSGSWGSSSDDDGGWSSGGLQPSQGAPSVGTRTS